MKRIMKADYDKEVALARFGNLEEFAKFLRIFDAIETRFLSKKKGTQVKFLRLPDPKTPSKQESSDGSFDQEAGSSGRPSVFERRFYDRFSKEIDAFFQKHPNGLSDGLISELLLCLNRLLIKEHSLQLRYQELLDQKNRATNENNQQLVLLKEIKDREKTSIKTDEVTKESSESIIEKVKRVSNIDVEGERMESLQVIADGYLRDQNLGQKEEILIHKVVSALKENLFKLSSIVWALINRKESAQFSYHIMEPLGKLLKTLSNSNESVSESRSKSSNQFASLDEGSNLVQLIHQLAQERNLEEFHREQAFTRFSAMYLRAFPGQNKEAEHWAGRMQHEQLILSLAKGEDLAAELNRIAAKRLNPSEGWLFAHWLNLLTLIAKELCLQIPFGPFKSKVMTEAGEQIVTYITGLAELLCVLNADKEYGTLCRCSLIVLVQTILGQRHGNSPVSPGRLKLKVSKYVQGYNSKRYEYLQNSRKHEPAYDVPIERPQQDAAEADVDKTQTQTRFKEMLDQVDVVMSQRVRKTPRRIEKPIDTQSDLPTQRTSIVRHS